MSKELIVQASSIFHSEGLYIPTRTIEIFGEINENSKEKTIKNLHILDNIENAPVTIKLSSPGGNVEDGLAIYDAIRAMKSPVRIISYGGVSSMASVIFQAADTQNRLMTPNSYLMLHEGESGVIAHPRNKKAWEALQDSQNRTCEKIYLSKIKEKKPRFTLDKLKNMIEFDYILQPKEAIEMGLADSIVEVY